MQVFGLPGHVIRSGRAASRLAGAKSPVIATAARRDAVARWRAGMAQGLCAGGGQVRRRAAVDALPLGEAARTALAAAAPAARASVEPGARRGCRGDPARQPDVEQAQDRGSARPRGSCDVGLDGGTHPRGAGRARRGHAGSDPAPLAGPTAREAHHGPALGETPAQGAQGDAAGRARPDRHAVRQRPARQPIKHLTAYCPVAKWTVGRVGLKASAAAAKALLDKLIDEAPFKVTGIQVDGGSEFRADFEDECKRRGLDLFVLPTPAQRSRRARPIDLALRVLRLIRPAAPHRKTAAARRRLRAPLQHRQTPPSPRRTDPRPAPSNPERGDPAVSYGLSPDTSLTPHRPPSYIRPRRAGAGRPAPWRSSSAG
jgi:putative transposase